jgi:hypothetical protein
MFKVNAAHDHLVRLSHLLALISKCGVAGSLVVSALGQ